MCLSGFEIGLLEKFQPILGFGCFLLDDTDLVDKVPSAFGAIGFPIIGPNGSSRPKQLAAEHNRNPVIWQSAHEFDDLQRKRFRPAFKFVFVQILNSQFSILNSNCFARAIAIAPHGELQGR